MATSDRWCACRRPPAVVLGSCTSQGTRTTSACISLDSFSRIRRSDRVPDRSRGQRAIEREAERAPVVHEFLELLWDVAFYVDQCWRQ